MKVKKKMLIICLMIILCSAFGVYAYGGGYLVKFKDGYYPDANEYNLKELKAERGIYLTNNLDELKNIENYIEYVSDNSKVSLIKGREIVTAFSMPQDELYPEQWQLKLINAYAGWNVEAYGNDIKVAVIDSGCFKHEDLKNNLLEGKNYLTGTNDVTDNDGHGTHVSGIIAAEINNVGIAGTAPKARIVPLKCFDPTYDTYVENVLDAIYDAVDIYKCKIINMSWGIANNDQFLKEAIDYADSKGVILVAAVGNYGSTTMYYPAAYENVIGVGSVGRDKSKSYFSQYNKSVFVTAPGEDVKSTYKDGSYQFLQGTSQSTPMVSGIAAVALSVDEKLSNEKFKQLLIETSEDLGTEGYDVKFGYGLVDEDALIKSLMENIKYYVSPINIGNKDAYVLIKNNTNNDLNGFSYFAEYDNNEFVECIQTKIDLPPDKTTILKTENNNNSISHFLWNGLGVLSPISLKREIDN